MIENATEYIHALIKNVCVGFSEKLAAYGANAESPHIE